jgi:hypothetical protein
VKITAPKAKPITRYAKVTTEVSQPEITFPIQEECPDRPPPALRLPLSFSMNKKPLLLPKPGLIFNVSLKDLTNETFLSGDEVEPIESVRDLANPRVRELARPIESVRILNSEDCSAKLEDESKDPVNDLNNEVFSLKFDIVPSEPKKDLKRDVCFAKLVLVVNESINDLNSEFFSVTVEVIPSEIPRLIVRPFNNELAILNESVRDLNSDVLSARFELAPIEVVSKIFRPLANKLVAPIEPDNDRCMERCSAKLDDVPNEVDSNLERPFA